MSTWEQVRSGSVVLAHDNLVYVVTDIVHGDPAGPVVTLERRDAKVGPAQPPPDTPITIIDPAEAAAFNLLGSFGLEPEFMRETG